jgi:hypothetical protein
VPTVKNHVTAILKNLKVTNGAQPVIAVRDFGQRFAPRIPGGASVDGVL